jgi:anti-sigma factor RsiW
MAMTTPTWHTDERLLGAYVAGALNALEGASVEQHLTRCADCRARVRPLTDLPALERGWDAVRTAVEQPHRPLLVRAAVRLGLPEPHAVLLAATVSLRTAWLVSGLVALAFAFLAAHWSSEGEIWPFLLVAPLIPVLGVAAAYDPADDPLESLIVTAPFGRGRLILLRTSAVLLTCLPVACLFGLMLPGPLWVAAAWLGPALAMVLLLFAVASFVGPTLAASVVALLWSGFVVGSLRPFGPTWPVEADQQLLHLGVAVIAVAALLARTRRTPQIGDVL